MSTTPPNNNIRQLSKGDILFREGDTSDAAYVIKSGRIAIVRPKGNGEIVLAEKKTGEMLGEMAFFDGKARSATAKAIADSVLIRLPFTSLNAQFKTFPEWLKAMVKTVNGHLRDANQKIKNLEQSEKSDAEMFPPHLITRLCAIISLVAYKSGEKTPEGLAIPFFLLRNYCIQIFQQPTNKLQKMMEVLQGLNLMIIEDLGEGKFKVVVTNHERLTQFVDWYNEYLFKDESKRITVEEKELNILRALVFYGKQQTPTDKGLVTVNLTEIQNNSMKDLHYLVGVNDADALSAKGLVNEKTSGEGGKLLMTFNFNDVARILPFWEMVYAIAKVPSR